MTGEMEAIRKLKDAMKELEQANNKLAADIKSIREELERGV